MNRHTRISDIGDIRIIGRANTIHKQLQSIAAHHSFINQSEEAQLTTLHSPEFQPASGGVRPSSGPANFQDIDAESPNYSPTISFKGN